MIKEILNSKYFQDPNFNNTSDLLKNVDDGYFMSIAKSLKNVVVTVQHCFSNSKKSYKICGVTKNETSTCLNHCEIVDSTLREQWKERISLLRN